MSVLLTVNIVSHNPARSSLQPTSPDEYSHGALFLAVYDRLTAVQSLPFICFICHW